MRTFKMHIKNKLKDNNFKKIFDEEKKLIELSLKIHEAREKSGLSQNEIAKKAQVTQQQLSKIENGINCNMITFLKVCNALNIDVHIDGKKLKKAS